MEEGWYREGVEICYKNETAGTGWCGPQEQCYDSGMVLPLVNESTWDWRLRAVLYLIGLLYRLKIHLDLQSIIDTCLVENSFTRKQISD